MSPALKSNLGNQTTPKTDRSRVDYMPCPAAVAALEAVQTLYPKSSTQDLIDRLVITGLSALVQFPPGVGLNEGWRWMN